MITVIDYGAGNLRSVENTLSELGAEYRLVRDPESVRAAEKLILPGVGHFGQLMRALDALGLKAPLMDRIHAGVPYLGICLGLQALFEESEEASEHRGLGLFQGTVRRFSNAARVPHMGWDDLAVRSGGCLLRGLPEQPFVYFAHSYYVPVIEAAAATCAYSVPYTAALESRNVFGVQFHPEKSGPIGLRVVRNFVEL